MVEIHHLNAGARGASSLVRDERDRHVLVRLLRRALGERVLAYCVMDTHVHVVAEGAGALRAASFSLRSYARAFNRRWGETGSPLRGPPYAVLVPGTFELARTIRYVHEQPLKTREPLVSEAVFFEASSAREHAGLSLARVANVARALCLLGSDAARARPWRPPLVDLDPVEIPEASPRTLLVASAQTVGVLAEDMASPSQARALTEARAIYARLGRLESYSDSQLGSALGKSRQRMTQLAGLPIDLRGVRIARTLVRVPGLRARLGARLLPKRTEVAGLSRSEGS